jgi:hypothetical protein
MVILAKRSQNHQSFEVAPVWWTVDSLASGFVVQHQLMLLLRGILWFGPRRSHSSVPTRRRTAAGARSGRQGRPLAAAPCSDQSWSALNPVRRRSPLLEEKPASNLIIATKLWKSYSARPHRFMPVRPPYLYRGGPAGPFTISDQQEVLLGDHVDTRAVDAQQCHRAGSVDRDLGIGSEVDNRDPRGKVSCRDT